MKIKLSHSVNGSNVWGSFGTFWWRPLFVQMEYLQKKEYFPFKTVIIDDSLQIRPEKKITKCHLEFSYFFICTATSIILHFMELVNFSHKYSIWTRGGHHQKVPNEPQTLDPFTEWLNFMFKYMNIYIKK